jgi:hypothetical protein
MNFKQATDALFKRTAHAQLAGRLNVSVAAIRQARLHRTARAHRSPPEGWQRAVVLLARERIERLRRLIKELGGGT